MLNLAQHDNKFCHNIEVSAAIIDENLLFKSTLIVINPVNNVKRPIIIGILTFMSRINFNLS